MTHPSIFPTVGPQFAGGLKSTRFVGYTRITSEPQAGRNDDVKDLQPILAVEYGTDVSDRELGKQPTNLNFLNCYSLETPLRIISANAGKWRQDDIMQRSATFLAVYISMRSHKLNLQYK